MNTPHKFKKNTRSFVQTYHKKIILIIIALLFLILLILPFINYTQEITRILKLPIFTFKNGIALSLYNMLFGGLAAIVVYILGNFAILKLISGLDKYKVLKNNSNFIVSKTLRVLLYFLSALVLLNIVGIPLTTVNILTGSLGFGLVFGLQKITSNFISGFIIAFEHSINPGDVLILSDGTWGVVQTIKGRYTLIQTYDGKNYMIPNEQFITKPLVNLTKNDLSLRFEIIVGVAYGTDLELALSLMKQAVHPEFGCSIKHEPMAMIDEFADSAINLRLRAWASDLTQAYSTAKSAVMLEIWKSFQQHHINIPFPQYDVHLHNNEKNIKS